MSIQKTFLSGISILCGVIALNCCSSKDSSKEENKMNQTPQISKVSLSPHTADIDALVLSMVEKDKDMSCKLKIKVVSEYGPSTPPLPANSEIEIQIPKSVIENEKIKTGSNVLVRVSYYHTPMDENNYWAFVKFN